jgi:hypothetical protein
MDTSPAEKRFTPVNIDDNAAAFMAAVYARMPQKTTKPKTEEEKPGMKPSTHISFCHANCSPHPS